MKLSTIIRQATSGELKNLAVSNEEDVIVDYINLAMIALYARFPLKIEEAMLNLQTAKTLYRLDGTDSDVEVEGAPIEEDNVLAVLDAFDESGRISINDEDDDLSIFTASYNTIQVPISLAGAYISVIYQAAPEEVVYVDSGDGSATDTDVPLPKQLLEPLLHYIGYRAHGAVEGNVQAENNTHLMRFEASCARAEALGMVPADSYNRKNSVKGFLV